MRVVAGFALDKDATWQDAMKGFVEATEVLDDKAYNIQREVEWFSLTIERNPQTTNKATYTLKADLK